jgi:hypothetical protein
MEKDTLTYIQKGTQITENNVDPSKAFMKVQITIETAISDFEMASSDQDRNKAFKRYSNAVDKLVAIPNPTQEIDDYIFECIVRAKKLKKTIDNPVLKSSVLD